MLTLIIFFQIIGYEKMSHFFHPNDQVEIRRAYLQRGFCQLLGHDFLKKKLMEHCVDLILISLKNTKLVGIDHKKINK